MRAMKIPAMVIIGMVVATLLVACGSPRYAIAPDSSWQERDSYCFFFQVDPRGSYNNQVGWSDTEPIIEATAAGFTLRAKDARVNLGNHHTTNHGNADEDLFLRSLVWATDSDGFVAIEEQPCGEGVLE